MLKQKKEEGNKFFKSRNLTEAFDTYSEALAIDPCNKFVNAKLYLNRAIVAAKVRIYCRSDIRRSRRGLKCPPLFTSINLNPVSNSKRFLLPYLAAKKKEADWYT